MAHSVVSSHLQKMKWTRRVIREFVLDYRLIRGKAGIWCGVWGSLPMLHLISILFLEPHVDLALTWLYTPAWQFFRDPN